MDKEEINKLNEIMIKIMQNLPNDHEAGYQFVYDCFKDHKEFDILAILCHTFDSSLRFVYYSCCFFATMVLSLIAAFFIAFKGSMWAFAFIVLAGVLFLFYQQFMQGSYRLKNIGLYLCGIYSIKRQINSENKV
jgi:hypothetical protein